MHGAAQHRKLILTPDNPAPAGGMVSWVTTADGLNLRAARWSCGEKARGSVTIATGRGEFIEKYFEVVGELLARRFDVVVMDWRGQGLSDRLLPDRLKGHVADFSFFEDDLDALARQVLEPFCPRPWLALGHSMGGAVLLAQAGAGRSPFARVVLSSPMIQIALPFPRAANALTAGLERIGLGGSFVPGRRDKPNPGAVKESLGAFDGNKLTADARRFARNAAILREQPLLAIGDPTVSWLNAAFRLTRRLRNPDFAPRTPIPVLIVAAGADRIAETPAAELYAGRLKAGAAITLADSRHEILMERDPIRQQFWAAFDAFAPGSTGG